jgi:hypothetical protein
MELDVAMWHEIKQFFRDIHSIATSLAEIAAIEQAEDLPQSFTVSQIDGGTLMAVTLGVPAGGQGTFGIVSITPSNAQFPAGTTFTWSVDDTANVTLTPSADTTTCVAAVAAGDQNPSFTITQTSNFTPSGASAPLASSVTVPVTGEVPPVVLPTAFQVGQLA